jgi:uncharacterized protein (TIRG00374 family)
MKSTLWNLLKLAITLGLIAFLATRVDWNEMARVVANAQVLPLVVALVLYFLAIALGAAKWQILARAQNFDASYADLLAYAFVGLFFGNFLPSNVGGDVVRAYNLARAESRAEAAAISVLVDRLLGLVAFLGAAVVMAVLAAFVVSGAWQLEQIEIATALVAAILIGGLALLFSRRVSKKFAPLFEFGPFVRIKPTAQNIYRALQVYRFRYAALAANVALSASIVVITALVWYAVALGLNMNVAPFYFFLFNPLIAFVLLVPISFNGLGPKEATAVFFFGLIGVPQEQAFSMSLIFHVIILLTSLPGGVLWLRERSLTPAPLPAGEGVGGRVGTFDKTSLHPSSPPSAGEGVGGRVGTFDKTSLHPSSPPSTGEGGGGEG